MCLIPHKKMLKDTVYDIFCKINPSIIMALQCSEESYKQLNEIEH